MITWCRNTACVWAIASLNGFSSVHQFGGRHPCFIWFHFLCC